MNTRSLLRIAIPVAVALLVAGGAVAITASAAGLRVAPLAAATSPKPAPSPAASGGTGRATDGGACEVYLGHLATQLGVSRAKLDSAAIAAARSTLQDEVAKGTVTQAEADKISARLAAHSLCPAGLSGHRAGHGRASAAMSAYLSAAAVALRVSEDQLKQDLKGGQTLSQVAAAQGVSETDFKAKVTATLKPKLDAAVAAKTITQAREDAVLAKLQAGDPPLWNTARK
jgi:uncharacterized protein YidB (DUF937 family)